MCPYQTLLYTLDAAIATVRVNRPDKLNALNNEVLDELSEVFRHMQQDDAVKGVLLTGSGDKAFVAGADIKELNSLTEQEGKQASQKGQQIFQFIEDMRKPVIAVINGYALGGGAELAMACHLRIAGKEAAIGLPEVGLGLIPGYGGTQRLTQIVGRARALQMILTGKPVDAQQALQIGLVNRVAKEPYEEAKKLLLKILSNGPLAVQKAIEAVSHAGSKAGFEKEAELFGALCATDDAKEGTTAFLEKRKPDFKGV